MSAPKKIDRADFVNVLWPVDGPHTAESVIAAAGAIEELWRYLAHATRRSDSEALAYPADVYIAVGRLGTGARSAVQVLSQLQRWSVRLQSVEGLTRDDDRADHERAVFTAEYVMNWLSDARRGMSEHANALDQVAAALGHLYIDCDQDEPGSRR